MTFRQWLFQLISPPVPTIGGKCQICNANAVIWLNGQQLFCWDHYAEELQRQRELT